MSEEDITCAFCHQNLQSFTLGQREDHYEAHFLETSIPATPDLPEHPSNSRDIKKRKSTQNSRHVWKSMTQRKENDIFWYPSLGIPPPSPYTPGLIPILQLSLNKLYAQGKVLQAVLCHEKVVHVAKELWDAGWGCGYRNFLMLCTGLLEQQVQPLYFALLDDPPPSIRNLQRWIQAAWSDGYDTEGANELQHKIIGTTKWIGTAEIWVAFAHRGIPAELVDFRNHNSKESCAAAVINWMVEYFTSQNTLKLGNNINDVLGKTPSIVVTELMPVILQHKGHSRLIVGYQKDVNGTVSLLTFDTGRLLPRAIRNFVNSNYPTIHSTGASSSSGRQEHEEESSRTNDKKLSSNDQCPPDPRQMQKALKLDFKQIASHAEYQILYVPLRPPLSDQEKLARKTVTSRKITGYA